MLKTSTYLRKYGHVEESISSLKIKRLAKNNNSLLASCFQRELAIFVAGNDRVGDVRVRRVWSIAVNRLDASEDGQAHRGVLVYGHIVAWK